MVGPVGSSPTAFPEGGQFRTLLNSFFSRDTEERKQSLWDAFLLAYNYTVSPPDTDAGAVALWGTFLNAAQQKPVPISGFYNTAIDSFMGTELSAAEKQAIWERFLNRINYAFNPTSTDLSAQTEFIKFLQYIVQENYRVESSPQEAIKRNILLDTFSLIISLLAVLQATVKAHTDSLSFYTKMQEMITLAMSKVPVYTQNKSSAWSVNVADPSQWIVGYPTVTIADIADHIARAFLEGIETTFEFSSSPDASTNFLNSYITFRSRSESTVTGPTITVRVEDNRPSSTIPGTAVSFSMGWVGDTSGLMTLSQEELSERIQTLFIDLYLNRTPAPSNPPPNNFNMPSVTTTTGAVLNSGKTAIDYIASITGHQPGIGAPYTGSDNDGIRGEANTRLQQYLESLRSQKDTWKNRQKIVEAQLDRDKESVSQLTNFIASFADTLKNLLAAIFR